MQDKHANLPFDQLCALARGTVTKNGAIEHKDGIIMVSHIICAMLHGAT